MATVTGSSALPGELGRGPLGRFALLALRLAAITAGFLIASLPTSAGLLLAPQDGLGPGIAVLLGAPALLAWSAALSAWRDDLRSLHPAPWRAFWRGWARNAVDVLWVVIAPLLVLAVIAVNVTNLGATGVGLGYGWGLLVIAAIIVVVTSRAVVLATFFSFRVRDIWRLAAYSLVARPMASIAMVAMLVCATALVWLVHEAVLLLLAGLAARAVLHYEQPVLALIRDRFTHDGASTTT